MISTPLPVSYFNVLLNVLVVFLGWLAHEFGMSANKKLTEIRLQNTGRAPMTPETDHAFMCINRGIRRAAHERSFGPLFVFALTSSLIFMEILSEFGVDSSNFCSPRRLHVNDGICAETTLLRGSVTKHVATIAMAQAADWRFPKSGAVVRQGFRKNFNGKESFHSESSANKSYPVVVGDCKLSPVEILRPGEAAIQVSRSNTG